MADDQLDRSTILVVDDETLVRMITAEILLEAGFKVLEACCAAEAVTALEGRADIALMVTDIEMPPGMDGIELAVEVGRRWPEVAVVLTSGRITPDDARPFIAKPFRAAELIAGIAAYLPDQTIPPTDDELMDEWHEAELVLAGAGKTDRQAAEQRGVAAEQRAIERFGRGPHLAEYELRYPSA